VEILSFARGLKILAAVVAEDKDRGDDFWKKGRALSRIIIYKEESLMKVAIPVEGKSIESSVCQSFGRTPYLLIYDTETKESEFLDNTASLSQGGAGVKAAQAIVDNRIDALLTPRCGQNAAEVISAASIKIYKTINDSIQGNIDAYNDDKLSSLDNIHAGLHNHRG